MLAAGNNGLKGGTTADELPQRLGTPDNNVITIGGVLYDGTLWKESSPEGEAGSVTAYGPVGTITLVTNDGQIVPNHIGGTSYAAPITVSWRLDPLDGLVF